MKLWKVVRVFNCMRNGFDDLTNAVEEGGMNEEPNDFDDSADELWSLYGDVAKRHDEARIRALKEDMDGIPVYVRPYFQLTYQP